MFTGLIEEIGTVERIEASGEGSQISIKASRVMEGLSVGDSVAVDGACQTVTRLGQGSFTVFASRITCAVTTLGEFRPGRFINLERALTLSSRLGGHIVQGHVDGIGVIEKISRERTGVEYRISADPRIMKYLVPKGSVAVDGISLTVVSADKNGFTIYIIPETITKTTLDSRKQGDKLNLEVDVLAKYVERMLDKGGGDGNSKDRDLKLKLMEEGYLS